MSILLWRFSLDYFQTHLATAIQQTYDLDGPPELTIERIGRPTLDDETWEDSTTQVRSFHRRLFVYKFVSR